MTPADFDEMVLPILIPQGAAAWSDVDLPPTILPKVQAWRTSVSRQSSMRRPK